MPKGLPQLLHQRRRHSSPCWCGIAAVSKCNHTGRWMITLCWNSRLEDAPGNPLACHVSRISVGGVATYVSLLA